DGSISHAQIARSLDPIFDKEALRVVNNMPKWIPGKQNGKTVRVSYNVPVSFRMD
ncbi:MAG: energy transducer TonB, partial [Prevotella sp.]|nr:energy transducer TonB [Prevotella sp.]